MTTSTYRYVPYFRKSIYVRTLDLKEETFSLFCLKPRPPGAVSHISCITSMFCQWFMFVLPPQTYWVCKPSVCHSTSINTPTHQNRTWSCLLASGKNYNWLACRPDQDNLLKFKTSMTMEKEDELSDFGCNMDVGARWAGRLFQKLLI